MEKATVINGVARGISRKKLIVFFTVITVISTAIAGTIFYLLNKESAVFEYDDSSIIGLMPGVDRDAMLDMLQENADKTAIAFSINSAPTVINQTMNILFENPDGNGKDVSIAIYDIETGDVIYKSKALKEGSYLSNIKLDRKYDIGQHTVTAYITAYDRDTHELIGEAAAELVLNVIEVS